MKDTDCCAVGLCNAACSRQDATQFVGRAASNVPTSPQRKEGQCGWWPSVSLTAARDRNESSPPPPLFHVVKVRFHKTWGQNEINCTGMGVAELNLTCIEMVIKLRKIVSRWVSLAKSVRETALTVEMHRKVCILPAFFFSPTLTMAKNGRMRAWRTVCLSHVMRHSNYRALQGTTK